MKRPSGQASRPRRLLPYVIGVAGVAALVFLAFQCESVAVEACPQPDPASEAARQLAAVRSQAGFQVLYPCKLPLAQKLSYATIVGNPGRQSVTLVFEGPFDLTVRQSQHPPAVNPDPTGASRTLINIFPEVRATLIERYDGSAKAQYHLLWERRGLFYEVQAIGPPQQRRLILNVATSLEAPPASP